MGGHQKGEMTRPPAYNRKDGTKLTAFLTGAIGEGNWCAVVCSGGERRRQRRRLEISPNDALKCSLGFLIYIRRGGAGRHLLNYPSL